MFFQVFFREVVWLWPCFARWDCRDQQRSTKEGKKCTSFLQRFVLGFVSDLLLEERITFSEEISNWALMIYKRRCYISICGFPQTWTWIPLYISITEELFLKCSKCQVTIKIILPWNPNVLRLLLSACQYIVVLQCTVYAQGASNRSSIPNCNQRYTCFWAECGVTILTNQR